jgi:hypothetical protein
MSPLRILIIVLAIVLLVAGVLLWRALGDLVVGFAKMEAEERIEENAPGREGVPVTTPPEPGMRR